MRCSNFKNSLMIDLAKSVFIQANKTAKSRQIYADYFKLFYLFAVFIACKNFARTVLFKRDHIIVLDDAALLHAGAS